MSRREGQITQTAFDLLSISAFDPDMLQPPADQAEQQLARAGVIGNHLLQLIDRRQEQAGHLMSRESLGTAVLAYNRQAAGQYLHRVVSHGLPQPIRQSLVPEMLTRHQLATWQRDRLVENAVNIDWVHPRVAKARAIERASRNQERWPEVRLSQHLSEWLHQQEGETVCALTEANDDALVAYGRTARTMEVSSNR